MIQVSGPGPLAQNGRRNGVRGLQGRLEVDFLCKLSGKITPPPVSDRGNSYFFPQISFSMVNIS